jgi:hypothetical protein
MDIILTESQYIQLLVERNETVIANAFEKSANITKKVVKDVREQYKIDFTAAGTWGAVIGGFIGPIVDYMSGTYTNLNQGDVNLIIFGVILTFFSSNKEKLNKVLQIIKEKGIITFFDQAIMKAYDLRDAFLGFMESLNLTMSKVSNMISYCFLIPLVPILKDLIAMDITKEQIDLITMGVTHWLGLSMGSKYVEQIVKSIINRIKTVDSVSKSDQ